MKVQDVSIRLKQFIFESVDSIELIDVLILMRNNPEKWLRSNDISKELRSSLTSIAQRLDKLVELNLVELREANKSYHFNPQTPELNELVDELVHEYTLRKHKIVELIFSPPKKSKK